MISISPFRKNRLPSRPRQRHTLPTRIDPAAFLKASPPKRKTRRKPETQQTVLNSPHLWRGEFGKFILLL
jgi:hypothetical protein